MLPISYCSCCLVCFGFFCTSYSQLMSNLHSLLGLYLVLWANLFTFYFVLALLQIKKYDPEFKTRSYVLQQSVDFCHTVSYCIYVLTHPFYVKATFEKQRYSSLTN